MGKSLEMGAVNYSVPCTTSGYGGFGCRPQLGQNAALVELHFYHQSQHRSKLWKPICMCCQCDFNGLIHVTLHAIAVVGALRVALTLVAASEVLESRWKTGVLTSVRKVFFSWLS